MRLTLQDNTRLFIYKINNTFSSALSYCVLYLREVNVISLTININV